MKIFSLNIGSSAQKKLMNELNKYHRIAENNPDDVRIHLRIAEMLMKMDKKYKAVEEYIHAAEAYEANNLSQIAAAIYKQVLQIDPDQVNVYHTLATIHKKEGFLGDAIATYEMLAHYYSGRGMKQEVSHTLKKMMDLDPDSPYLKNKVNRFCSEKDMNVESEKTPISGEGGEMCDHITSGRQHSGQTLYQTKEGFFDLEAALQDEFLTKEDTPKDLNGLSEGTDKSTLSMDEVFKEIQRAKAEMVDHDDSLYHYNLGYAFQKVGRIDDAIDEFIEASKDPARSADCYLRLSICSRDKEKVDEAIKYLKRGLRSKDLSETKKVELLYEMAVTYKAKEKKKKALRLFRQVHEMHSNFREVRKELDELSR